jgi:hypothetical protein
MAHCPSGHGGLIARVDMVVGGEVELALHTRCFI